MVLYDCAIVLIYVYVQYEDNSPSVDDLDQNAGYWLQAVDRDIIPSQSQTPYSKRKGDTVITPII